MSPTILSIVMKSLQKHTKIDENREKQFLNIVKGWKKGDIVYPNSIKSRLFISFDEVYILLDLLESEGILTYAFQIYCQKCNKFQDMPILR